MASIASQGNIEKQWEEALPASVYRYRNYIDKNQRKPFNTAAATPEAVNGYILERILFYIESQYADNMLWESFRKDFEDQTINIWKLANKNIVRELRTALRRYGVKVAKDGTKIADNLQEMIDNPVEPEWSQEDIAYQIKTELVGNPFDNEKNNFLSQRYMHNQQQLAYRPPQTPSQTTPVPTPAQLPAQLPTQQYGQQSNYQPAVPIRTYTPTPNVIPTKEITSLMKIYTNQDDKYGGEMYDILDAKLQVFYDYCNKAGIQTHQYYYAFSAMLKGRALVLYYSQIQGKMLDFSTMVQRIRDYFENDEIYQLYLLEWRETLFQRVINENPTKTRAKCL